MQDTNHLEQYDYTDYEALPTLCPDCGEKMTEHKEYRGLAYEVIFECAGCGRNEVIQV